MVCKLTGKINQKSIKMTFVLYVMIYSELSFAQITQDNTDFLVEFRHIMSPYLETFLLQA